ncbi:MAG: DUF3187 family protein, partial [Actinobacteria bacterium]|nr:DUF3187 family protein [Actinomycetota bacterium]
LYLERARPIGRGKWNVTLSYQRVAIDAVQGEDLDGLRDDDLPIITTGRVSTGPRGPSLLKFDRYDVGLTVDEVTLAATYGITDDLDVNLTLPILASTLSIDARARTFTRNPNDNSLVPVPPGRRPDRFSQGTAHAAGVGDLLLRAKYRFWTHPWVELAGGLVLRMPTGDKDDFQGTGAWELSPLLYVSTPRFRLGGPVAVQGFFNGGLDLNLEDVDRSEGRFGAGVDLALGRRVTLSLAFLGREPFQRFAPAGSFDVARYNPRTGCPVAEGCGNRRPMAPLFGLDTVRPSYYSLSIGGRVNLWRDTVFGFANVLVPLSDEGIHTDPIPLIGFEA